MRRLTALLIVSALAWFVVDRGTGPSGLTALALGLALLASSIVGWLLAFLRLPRITGYLLVGLLCSPAVSQVMTPAMARDLRAASGLAIALIAFIAGLQFPMMRRTTPLRQLAMFATSTFVAAWSTAAIVLFLVWPWIPVAPALGGLERAIIIAIAATMLAAVSPSVTVAVIAEARASGPFAALATSTSLLIGLLATAAFTIGLAAARPVFGPTDRKSVV